MLPILGEKLEREALSRYSHAEKWAVRGVLHDSWKETEPSAWERLKTKFREEIAQELMLEQLQQFPTEEILDGLPGMIKDYIIGMVRLYHKENFDPLGNYMRHLEVRIIGEAVAEIRAFMPSAEL